MAETHVLWFPALCALSRGWRFSLSGNSRLSWGNLSINSRIGLRSWLILKWHKVIDTETMPPNIFSTNIPNAVTQEYIHKQTILIVTIFTLSKFLPKALVREFLEPGYAVARRAQAARLWSRMILISAASFPTVACLDWCVQCATGTDLYCGRQSLPREDPTLPADTAVVRSRGETSSN